MTTVLIVDDQERARELLGAELREAGFSVVSAADGEEGWQTFCRTAPSVVVTDMAMPRCDGIELLRRIRSRSDVPVIVFSGHGSIEAAANAFKAGADDFVNSLDLEIDGLVSLVRQSAHAPHAPPSGVEIEQRLVGESTAIRRIRWQISGLAPLSAPVLATGEPGTGRTAAIQTMHELGSNSLTNVVEIKVPRLFCDLRVQYDLHQEIAQLLTKRLSIAAIQRFEHFIRLFQQVRPQRLMILCEVPRAAPVRIAQPRDHSA